MTIDGRVVTRADDGELVERTLRPLGAQRVRDEVLATGLFQSDQRFSLEPVPGPTPPPHGLGALSYVVWNGSRTVRVSTAPSQGLEEIYYRPSLARTRLDRLSAQLRSPETWLATDAWLDVRPHSYVAEYFRLLVAADQFMAPDTSVDLSAVEWPFVTPLPDFGQIQVTAGSTALVALVAQPVAGPARCGLLTRDDLAAVRAALDRAAAGASALPNGGFIVTLKTGAPASTLLVVAEPLLPDDNSCAQAFW